MTVTDVSIARAFSDLVSAELRGEATPEEVSELHADPIRWKAALATLIEDVDRQLASRHDEAWAPKALFMRRVALARLIDVRAIVKKEGKTTANRRLDARVRQLLDGVRRIELIVSEGALPDSAVRERVGEIAAELLGKQQGSQS